ncbi:MAG TPA: hypothetical protein VLT45_17110 [Kofleriaceae bacterium]|nr:hypothetical protein [Kofleriaceae bacterium]
MNTDPISALLALLPPTARMITGSVFAMLAIVSSIVALTSKRDAPWAKTLRFISMLVHHDEPGTLKIPFTNIVLRVQADVAGPGVPGRSAPMGQRASGRGNAGHAHRGPLVGAVVVTIVGPLVIAMLLHGCAGSTTNVGATSTVSTAPGGNVAWTVGVNVGITIAKQALPAVNTLIDQQPGIPADAKQRIDTGFRAANDSLDLARTAFNTYAESSTTANMCRVHFYIEQAITGALQSMALVRDAGVQIDPGALASAQAALGSLGAIADMLYPACASSGPPARHVPAMQRIHDALGSNVHSSAAIGLGALRIELASVYADDVLAGIL